jgi:cell division protein FtsQ
VASSRRPEPGPAQKRPAAKAAALPRAKPARLRIDLRRVAPSGRSLLVGLALLALGVGVYFAARDTSLFAVRTIEIAGGGPRVQAEVRRRLEPAVGHSLVGLDLGGLERQVDALPDVVGVRFDRAFPHMLKVVVRPERPVAVMRQGASAWLVSARGRIMRPVGRTAARPLPRIWLPARADVSVGATLADPGGMRAVRAAAGLAPSAFPARVRFVDATQGKLALVLMAGAHVILGDASDLALKLAVAGQVLRTLPPYPDSSVVVDVSVPERPVSGTGNPQVGG